MRRMKTKAPGLGPGDPVIGADTGTRSAEGKRLIAALVACKPRFRPSLAHGASQDPGLYVLREGFCRCEAPDLGPATGSGEWQEPFLPGRTPQLIAKPLSHCGQAPPSPNLDRPVASRGPAFCHPRVPPSPTRLDASDSPPDRVP